MNNSVLWRWMLFFSFTILFGCSEFRKVQKSDDWKEKFDAAVAYFEKEDYYRCSVLLEEILPIIRGTKEAELANFYYAYSYFHQKQYLLSATYFSDFANTYGRSQFSMEAEYMAAYSLYLQSPDYNLDQTSTVEAIQALQSFVNTYPTSEYAIKATELIIELRQKLESKDFENAKQYHKLSYWKSAITALENFEKSFPDSKLIEESFFLKIDAAHQLAKQSIQSKQKERFQTVINYYLTYLEKYPNSPFIKEAEKLYASSIEQIEQIGELKN